MKRRVPLIVLMFCFKRFVDGFFLHQNQPIHALTKNQPIRNMTTMTRLFSTPKSSEYSRSVGSILSSAMDRAQSTLRQTDESKDTSSDSTNKGGEGRLQYHGNPAIANTALAHTLWSTVLHPNRDSAIDATCGNGQDSLAIARILFRGNDTDLSSSTPKLWALDIQANACSNTTAALTREFGPKIVENHVHVLQTSHSPLPSEAKDVGLVVYNLGWLPNSDKDCITKVDSTLSSLVDAILKVRIGGMISVMTYPKTNPEEDIACRLLLESVALLSSNIQTWEDFLENFKNDISQETFDLITSSMEQVIREGNPRQTWRVSENRKLGMDRAPILVTATRIK